MPQKKFIIIREKVAHITKAPSMTTLPIRIDLTTENLNYQVHNWLNWNRLNPKPSTFHRRLQTLNPEIYTLHPEPWTLNPVLYLNLISERVSRSLPCGAVRLQETLGAAVSTLPITYTKTKYPLPYTLFIKVWAKKTQTYYFNLPKPLHPYNRLPLTLYFTT